MSYVYGLGDAQEAASRYDEQKYEWLDNHQCKCPECDAIGISPYNHKFEGGYDDDDFPDCILMYICDECGHEWEEYQ